MAEPPPRPPDDDETVIVPPDETVVDDEWAVAPERRVAVEERREEIVEEPPRKPPLLWPGLLALLVLVLGGLGVAWYLSQDDEDEPPATTAAAEQVVVPRVVGLTEERAQEELQEVDLDADVTRRAAEQPEGVVVEQDPGEGTRVDPGTAVVVVVSDGQAVTTTGGTTTTTTTAPATARVPEVVGQSSSAATATLRDAGFEVALVQVPSDEPAGTVVAQNPAAGAEAERGSEVRLNVAEAQPEPATVPDVVGQAAAGAAQAFAAEGLRVALRYVPSSEPAGTVVAQAQAPGTELAQGQTVQVNVSTGAEPAEPAPVPDVAGQPLDEARETLSSAGFEVLALNLAEEVSRTDTVSRQTPAAGASIPRGSLVVLYVTR